MGIAESIAGGLISGVGSLVGAGMTNSANKDIAQDANAQQERLAGNAHQREVADLRAAGLNPILSAGGSGAAVPSMHTATMENPAAGLTDALSKGISNYSALQNLRQIDPAIEKTRSEAKLNDALQAKAAADTSSALAQAQRTTVGTAMDLASTGKIKMDTALSSVQRSLAEAQTRKTIADEELSRSAARQNVANTSLTSARQQSVQKSPFVSHYLGSDFDKNLANILQNVFNHSAKTVPKKELNYDPIIR